MTVLGDLISPAQLDKCGTRDFPVLSMTMHDGIMLQSERFKKSLASIDQSAYKVVQRNQLVVGFPIDEGVLYIQKVVDAGIMSPAYDVWNVKQDIVNLDYLELSLHSPQSMLYYRTNLRGSTARRRSLPKEILLSLPVKLPDMESQRRVVSVIAKVKDIILLYKRLLSALDNLIKARFVEMFGDMLLNPKNLPEQRLDSLADIAAGITKGRKVKTDELYEVPYMAVSNVKDGFIDWTTVKTIMATAAEIDQYRLMPGDVLMTEGGDPDKLGRGAIIHEPPENCIHQNHIFRVRLNQDELLPVYMAQYLQQQKAKKYFLGCAKQTTGIASINMKQLRALPVLVPKIELQNKFAAFATQIDKSKSAIQKSLDETQLLFDSLMQQYFG